MIGALQTITAGAAQIRGRGLMIGIETDPEMLKDRNLREDLLWKGFSRGHRDPAYSGCYPRYV